MGLGNTSQRDMRKHLRVMDMITTLTMEMISQVYPYVITYQIVSFKLCHFIVRNYTSIKFFFFLTFEGTGISAQVMKNNLH